MWPKRAKVYLHSSKECMRDSGEELGLQGEALREFSYALYEVEFDLEVNENGTYKILSTKG